MEKIKFGIIGGTGMVGQYFISLLKNHPWFEISVIAASEQSCGKTYKQAIEGRHFLRSRIPQQIANMEVMNALDVEGISEKVDFVFSAVSLGKDETALLEEKYAKCETPVVSNNSAHRWTPDVPMIIPEVNPEHIKIINSQRRRLKTKRGFIAVKPNCSVQSYVPAIHALQRFNPTELVVSTYQAVSGAGKTMKSWPEMQDNVIPFISGEEEKSQQEPLKIWGNIKGGKIVPLAGLAISAQCIRVPVSYGHMATVFVSFNRRVDPQSIVNNWRFFQPEIKQFSLPSSPEYLLTYFDQEDRPQTNLDRNIYGGMGISLGRLRRDPIFDYKFVSLSHNLIRGAAGGAILLAELLKATDFIRRK